MKTALILVVGVLALYMLHRVALWMESRGWIYYQKTKPSGTSLGNAFLEIQQIAQPEKRHVLEMKRTQRAEQDDASGSDDAAK